MHQDVRPLVEERDRLENKRDRIRELLADGPISDEMRSLLRQSLRDADLRLAMLAANGEPPMEHRLAA